MNWELGTGKFTSNFDLRVPKRGTDRLTIGLEKNAAGRLRIYLGLLVANWVQMISVMMNCINLRSGVGFR